MKHPLGRRTLTECFGTFFLVFAGTAAISFNQLGGEITHVGVSLTFGLVVMILIYAIGSVSGAHMNPAVSIGLAAAGQFRWRDVPFYLAGQVVGAFLASILLYIFVKQLGTELSLGATEPRRVLDLQTGQFRRMSSESFVLEILLTFVLMYTVLSVIDAKADVQALGGIIIGGVIALEALFAGPICGASMNPARSLAPAVVSGRVDYLPIYLTAPVLGALLAVPFWRFIHQPDSEGKKHA